VSRYLARTEYGQIFDTSLTYGRAGLHLGLVGIGADGSAVWAVG